SQEETRLPPGKHVHTATLTQASDRLTACTAWDHLDHSGRVHLARSTHCTLLRDALSADVSEFRHRILMQRPASPFVISNAVRGTWQGRWYPTLGWARSPTRRGR